MGLINKLAVGLLLVSNIGMAESTPLNVRIVMGSPSQDRSGSVSAIGVTSDNRQIIISASCSRPFGDGFNKRLLVFQSTGIPSGADLMNDPGECEMALRLLQSASTDRPITLRSGLTPIIGVGYACGYVLDNLPVKLRADDYFLAGRYQHANVEESDKNCEKYGQPEAPK